MKKILLLFLLVSFSYFAQAQDAIVSQYYASSLFLNPAIAGTENVGNLQFISRNRLGNNVSGYHLHQFSVVFPIMLKNADNSFIISRNGYLGGGGISFYNETSGFSSELKNTGLLLSLAYSVKLTTKQLLSFGIQGGAVYRTLDDSNLQWGSQYENLTGFNSGITPSVTILFERMFLPIFNAGIEWRYIAAQNSLIPSAVAGFAAANINRPYDSFLYTAFSYIPVLFKFYAGAQIFVGENKTISPNVFVLRQRNAYQTNVGCAYNQTFRNAENKTFTLQVGSWYRWNDSFIVSFAFLFPKYDVAVSYDFNASSFRYYEAQEGALEVSCKYYLQ